MQLGVNLWVWGAQPTDDQLAARLPAVADMGFDVVEFPLEDPGGFDHEAAAARCDALDLETSVVVAMTPERDLLHDDPDVRENGREYVRACIDAAVALGADRVVGPLYSAVGRTWRQTPAERDEMLQLLVEQLGDLATYAGERDVTLCVEPLNRFETSVLNTMAQTVSVVDRVDHPACQILVDTFHMNIEETSLPDAIRTAGDRIGHVHACGNDRGAPGNGHIDWRGVADALDDVGYDDQLVIESFTPEVESIATAAAIWRPIEPSQDRLATDGLAFLEQQFQ